MYIYIYCFQLHIINKNIRSDTKRENVLLTVIT